MALVWVLPDFHGHCLLVWHIRLRATDHEAGSCIAFSSPEDTYNTQALAVALKGLDAVIYFCFFQKVTILFQET